MKAVFVSEIADHIVLSLDLTKPELAACTEDSESVAKALEEAVLAACRTAGYFPELPQPKPLKTEEPVSEPQPPFRAEHYKGVRIRRIRHGQDGLSPEELMKEQLLDTIIACNDIYIPEEQIASETDYEFVGRSQALKYQGMMSGDYSRYQSYGTQENREEVERDVIRQIKVEKILKSIIEQENITATQEELEAKAKAISEKRQLNLDIIERFFGEDYSLLQGDILKEKAIQLIFDSAIFLNETSKE